MSVKVPRGQTVGGPTCDFLLEKVKEPLLGIEFNPRGLYLGRHLLDRLRTSWWQIVSMEDGQVEEGKTTKLMRDQSKRLIGITTCMLCSHGTSNWE